MAGEKKAKTARFVKTHGADRALDQASLARAQSLVGLKGYVTNIPVTVMPAAEVIAKYHDLWHVEKSFRMSKSDLDARPMFNRIRDAIEAHLTIVFAALAVSHTIQSRTGLSIAKVIKLLRPLRSATITINGATQTFPRQSPTPRDRSSPTSASTLGTKRNVQTQEPSANRRVRSPVHREPHDVGSNVVADRMARFGSTHPGSGHPRGVSPRR